MNNWLNAALEQSNISARECADFLGQSEEVFSSKLRYPGTLTLNEIYALCSLLNDDSKKILHNAIEDLFS